MQRSIAQECRLDWIENTMSRSPLRVLHFCYSGHPQPGIIRQLEAETQLASGNIVDWQIGYFTHGKQQGLPPFVYATGLPNNRKGILGQLFYYVYLRGYALIWLLRRRSSWDLVLLRYMAGDPFLFLFCLASKHFLTVHHTKEEDEIKSNTGSAHFFGVLVERTLGKLVLKRSLGNIAVTNEILEYERNRAGGIKAGFLFPNCITITPGASLSDEREGKVKLVFVGSRSYVWNGLDYIYEELEASNRHDFELHIVGDIAATSTDSRVFYHGILSKEALSRLYQRMDLGLGTFGLHRKNMKEACTLKSRDYLANGLAVVADHFDSALPEDFPFYTRQRFKLDVAIEIALKNRAYSKQEIILAATKYIDKKKWLIELKHWLNDHFYAPSNHN